MPATTRDRLIALAAPFTADPVVLLETDYRVNGVIWGRADKVFAPADASALGQAKLRVVDGAGHMAHMEKPNEVVAAVEARGGATASDEGDEGAGGQ